MELKNEIRNLIGVYGTQKKTAEALGVTQGYISKLLKGSRGKKAPKELKTKISKISSYWKNKYFWQWRIKGKIDKFPFPAWFSGDLVEYKDLPDSLIRLEKSIKESYDEIKIIRRELKKYKKDFQYSNAIKSR